MFEVERLQGSAWALQNEADRLDDAVRRLRVRVEQTMSTGHWRGPSADRHWQTTQDRVTRMRHASNLMRDLAARFRRQAAQLREQERQRAAAAQRH